jgi:RNA polymerase sigma factor (sigma-70 family)
MPNPTGKPPWCPLLEGDLEPWIRCCTRQFLPLARRVAGDDEHAHDALHASWALVLEKLHQYRGEPPACGWVAAIVRHEALHDATARSRSEPLPDGDRPSADLPPDASIYADELRRLLMEAIDELPPTFQEIVRLRDIEDRPNAEVARRLHISKRAAATRLHRAHGLLRRRLQPYR